MQVPSALVGAVAAFVACAAPQVSGYSMYAMRVPNGANVPGVTALGHVDPVLAGPMNEFGMDMIDADFKWTKELCMKDSDGDGQTNGQELGDPCCEFVWRKNPEVRWTEGVSHPGDAEYMSDPKLWEGIVCESTADTAGEPANASATATSKAAATEAANTATEDVAAPVTNAPDNEAEKATETTEAKADTENGTVTEDSEAPILVSSGKTEGATHEEAAMEAAAAPEEKTAGAAPALFSSTMFSAVVVLGLLGFVVMRRRRSQWTLPRQQGRRAQ